MKKPKLKLTAYEMAILNAKPCDEPDRSKVNWGKQAPIIPESEEAS